MVESFLAFLSNLEATFSAANPTGLLVLGLLAIVTDIGVPVPFVLDTILILSAYNVLSSHSQEWTPVILIVITLFVGRQIGSGILYLISRFLGQKFTNWIKRTVPSIGCRLDTVRSRPTGWTPLAIVTGRLTPGLLQITSVLAGSIRVRYYHFALGVAISSLIYDAVLILLGFVAAHSPKAGDIDFTIWLLISMVAIVCLLWPLVFFLVQRADRKTCPPVKP